MEQTKLRDAADVLSGSNPAVLSKNDFEYFVTTLARTTTNWSDEGCRYFARLEPRGADVTGDEYVIRWTDDIRPHFAGLVNPGVCQKKTKGGQI